MNKPSILCEERNPLALDLVVVDDDLMILEILTWLIRKTVIQYKLFSDSDEAMYFLSKAQPSPRMLIVDYYMPALTGIDFLNELAALKDLSDMSVFICSAIEPGADKRKEIQSQGVRILDKSVISQREPLFEFLNEHLYDNDAAPG